jgi:hypothetical protein
MSCCGTPWDRITSIFVIELAVTTDRVRSFWALWQNEDSLASDGALRSRLDAISGHRRSRG